MRLRMTRGAVVLALLLLAAVVMPAGGRAQGGKFAGDGFTASFPGRPQKVTRRQDFDDLALNMASYGIDREGMSFFVSMVGDFPAFVMNRPEIDEVFYSQLEQNLILTAKESGKGDLTVAARSDVSLEGTGGRQYVFDSEVNMGVLRAYKSGRRFYAVGVFGPKQSYVAERAVSFLNSFRLTASK